MAYTLARCVLAMAVLGAAANAAAPGVGAAGKARAGALLQTWDRDLAGGKAKDTPITRVVNLLKEMAKTLSSEMEEDEALHKKLGCWCHNNEYEKDGSIEASTSKISELEASIESLTAKSGELTTSIQELEAELAADKKALAEATALRNKQLQEFQDMENDSIQAVENLKAAITVLSKHHEGAAPDSTVAGGAVFKSERDSWSMLQTGKDLPWTEQHEAEHMDRSLGEFMRQHGFDGAEDGPAALAADRVASKKFLRGDSLESGTSLAQSGDDAIIRKALKSAQAFMQAHHSEGYYPAYTAQSGEIYGVLKQLKEEMEGDLTEAQKREADRAAAFAELRSAKKSEIANGEKMAEQKEDELATTNNALAEAKEDLGQEKAVLSEDQKFLANLKETCAEADKNFAARKQSRLEEIKAVTETIEILTQDDARDAMSGTYNFIQLSSRRVRTNKDARRKAAEKLRKVAKKTNSPQLAVLATSVELDAFTKVKKAIDDMIATLKMQQSDEVKKSDWCKAEIQDNEMTTAKTTDHKADLEAQASELASNIKALEEGIYDAKAQISQLQLDLQRATEDRKAENLDFQKTVADQMVTVEVLKKALDKLATYYDQESLVQKSQGAKKQTPPVPQMEYAPSKGSEGVMQMIEKLIKEAQGLMADSKKSEQEAQAAYESAVADTNGSVAALQKEVVAKSKAKVKASKDKQQTEADIEDTQKEIEGLGKENADLHAECDYVLKNFGVRQEARAQEIEALQQAKQILSGAALQ